MDALNRLERRLKLHDLKVVEAVARLGSMGQAAAALNTSQPAISRSIADLEHALGVRLLERDRRGARPTEYGDALLSCGVAVFDALREGIKAIEFLGDPNVGEIKVGCTSPMTVRLLPSVCEEFGRRHPGVSIHVTEVTRIAQQYRELRERNVDLVIGRIAQSAEDDIETEVLFYDRSYIVAASSSIWSRRRKVHLSELAGERWLLPPLESVVGATVAEAFRGRGLPFPPKGAVTGSIQLICTLAGSGTFVSFLPGAVLHFLKGSRGFRPIKVDLQIPPWPVGIMTVRKRRLRPVVQLFVDQLRKTTGPLGKAPRS